MDKSSSSEVRINNIYKSYNKKLILDNISIRLKQGEIVSLFGPNGAGKTTCFSIIIGLVKPDKGELFLNEINITKLPIYQRARLGFSYLPQESSIFRGLSVGNNIRAILEITEKDRDIIDFKLDELLNEFSIRHLKDVSALSLSGGERRRVEIARTLATNPSFIMFDEPLAGIDPLSIMDIKKLILHLRDRNIGILITDHNVRDTLDVIDRGYIIYDGKVLLEGSPSALMSDPKAKELYLGDSFNLL